MIESEKEEQSEKIYPIAKAPFLLTISGFGLALRGSRNWDSQSQTYVSNYCVIFIYLPVFFLWAYRISPAMDGGYNFWALEPLSRWAKLWNQFLIVTLIAIALYSRITAPQPSN